MRTTTCTNRPGGWPSVWRTECVVAQARRRRRAPAGPAGTRRADVREQHAGSSDAGVTTNRRSNSSPGRAPGPSTRRKCSKTSFWRFADLRAQEVCPCRQTKFPAEPVRRQGAAQLQMIARERPLITERLRPPVEIVAVQRARVVVLSLASTRLYVKRTVRSWRRTRNRT